MAQGGEERHDKMVSTVDVAEAMNDAPCGMAPQEEYPCQNIWRLRALINCDTATAGAANIDLFTYIYF